MLKQTVSFIFALLLCLCLAACGNNGPSETATGTEGAVSPTEGSTQETEEDKNAEAVSEPEKEETVSAYVPVRYETDTLSWDFDAATGTLSIHGSGPMRTFWDSDPEWFVHRDEVRTVSLDEGITSIGAYAFCDFRSLTEARLPNSLEVIDDSAFDFDWELRTITIPTSLKYIGYRAFYNTLLWEPEDLVFPEGLEYIGDYAFHSALKSGGIVSLPASLQYLGAMAFTNAYLSDFVVAEGNPVYRSENHAIYTKDGKELRMLAPVTGGMGEFRVPDGVEHICEESFNVIQGISTVYIPASVTAIDEGAFFSTFDLEEIVVDEANPNYQSQNGLLLSKDGTLLLAWPDGIQGSELVIPDGVARLGQYLFCGRLGGNDTVILPEGVKELGTMSLPQSMASLSLPSTLEKIDAYVFHEGISVAAIHYNGTEADWEKITVGEGNGGLDRAAVHWKE